MQNQLFHEPSTDPVFVCKTCEHVVRPREVLRHLQSANHRLPMRIARQIAHIVQTSDRAHECDEWQPPTVVDQPIPNLPVFSDGILCEKGPFCQFIARTVKTMRQHWRDHHGWVAPTNHGGGRRLPTSEVISAAEQQIQQFTRIVRCQRAFPGRTGSHYIRVRTLGAEAITEADSMPATEVGDRLIDQIEQAFTEESELPQLIEAGERDDANPWLRRTQWAVYLRGINPQHLIDCVQAPDADSSDPTEMAASAIWDAMAAVARISQLVCTKTSHTIRTEAARTERDRLPHQPLQAYMDANNIERHTIPWQQILMFFTRTQAEHEWASPYYQFTKRQRAAWNSLWRLAQRSASASSGTASSGTASSASASSGRASSCESSKHSDESDSEDQPTRRIASELPNRPRNSSESQFKLTPIASACLDFCIELLNHRTKVEDYESALICAMAVLGRGEAGWRTAESYPPILSKVIKIARFMVVHKALKLDPIAVKMLDQLTEHQMAGEWETESPLDSPDFTFLTPPTSDDEFYNFETEPVQPANFETSPVQPPTATQSSQFIQFTQVQRKTPRSFREWVAEMVSEFMVRGTNSPIQWLLDLRTYGLKIHYNSTTTGHVGWMNQDQLLYQQYNFTMGDFRGFIHGLISSTRQILQNELLFCENASVPAIPWQAIYDDPTETAHGWNFLKDTRTAWPVAGEEWLIRRVRQDSLVRQRFIESSAGRLRMSAIDVYLQRVAYFREKLAIAIHISGGQPARAPELLSIRHCNTDSGGHRNVFIEDGLVAFVSQYHKGFYATNDTKVIHRYLPREVGELVVWYLWLVLPFTERLDAYVAKVRRSDGIEIER